MRAPPAEDDNRVVNDKVGPTFRDGPQPFPIVAEVDPVFGPVATPGYNFELFPGLGMEWMNDAKTSRRTVRIVCS